MRAALRITAFPRTGLLGSQGAVVQFTAEALRLSGDFRLPGTVTRARRPMVRPNVIILRQSATESP
jgi:hypothetical protein